jgi:gliding motility-associated lipoprotein GldD
MIKSLKQAGSLLIIAGFLALLYSCNSAPIPKSRGYFRLEFPEKKYTLFDSTFPYKFNYPIYGKITADNQAGAEKYWINIDFPKYKARIHISYKNVHGNVDNLIEDVRTLAYKHTIKADAINEKIFSNPEKKVYGILYDIRGNAASSYQFYVTDSVKHFLRGALYFNVHPNKDSLSPAVDFFGKDMTNLIESLEWK